MPKMSSFNKKAQKEELSEAPQVEELLKNLEFHKSIQSITGRINAAATLRDIVVDIKEDIRKLFNIHILTIYLIDKNKKEIFTYREDGSEIRFPIDNTTLPGFVAQKKRMLHIADAYDDREVRRIHDILRIDRTLDKKTGILTGQVIACPILRDNIMMGVMEIMNKKGGDKIDDYNQIFLDEIMGALAKTFYLHLNFAEAKQVHGAKFESLIQKGLLTSDQLDNAIKEISETRVDLASVLMEQHHISKLDIGNALSSFYACRFVQYSDDIPTPRDLLIGIEKYTLANMLWVPLKVVKGKIYVAIDDPSDALRKNKIEDILETKSIQYDVALASDIHRLINRFYYSEEESLRRRLKPVIPQPARPFDPAQISLKPAENSIPFSPEEANPEHRPKPVVLNPVDEFSDEVAPADMKIKQAYPATSDETKSVTAGRYEPPAKPEKEKFPDIDDLASVKKQPQPKTSNVISLPEGQMPQPLTNLINSAFSRRASDIHLEPDPATDSVVMRIRIDGQFSTLQPLSSVEYETLTGQIKTLSNLDAQNNAFIQNGRLSLKRPSGDEIHLRVSFIPTRTGKEDTVIHISTKLKKMPLELLGLSEQQYADLVNIVRQPRGLVLITGPAESGITTTLHACLDGINTPETKIWTAEEPVEIVQPGLRQVQIDPHRGFDFASVLNSFLDADPDVILASRIDDRKSAKLCMQAAIKGCLVFGGMWAESIPDTIERCLDMETGHLLFADAMLAIVQQRLIKTLCPKCKEKYRPSQEEYEELAQIYGKEAFEKLNIPYSNAFSLFRPKGCPDCNHTGYLGRMCVSETLIFTPEIKRRIRRKDSPQLIYQSALSSGTTTLMQDGINKVLQGLSDSRHVRLACLR